MNSAVETLLLFVIMVGVSCLFREKNETTQIVFFSLMGALVFYVEATFETQTTLTNIFLTASTSDTQDAYLSLMTSLIFIAYLIELTKSTTIPAIVYLLTTFSVVSLYVGVDKLEEGIIIIQLFFMVFAMVIVDGFVGQVKEVLREIYEERV